MDTELYDPRTPPPPRCTLLAADGSTLRTVHRAARVRVRRLDTAGRPVGETWEGTATTVSYGP